jgi:hypothetical protein
MSDQIRCDDGGGQCPPEWICLANVCVAPGGPSRATIDCPLAGLESFVETVPGDVNDELATEVACMAQVGIEGCGVEQQLQAGVRALSRSDQPFMRENHLLAVLAVSDEEDCSVQDAALFSTPEWDAQMNPAFNTACSLPLSNANYLFDPQYFYDTLVAYKGGRADAVVFAAIVGVPVSSSCQGTGDRIDGCLEDPAMQYEIGTFVMADMEYQHFYPACEREEDSVTVTSARPGRRYVEVAQAFGCAGYVYSICNADWRPAMDEIARIIAACID